MPGNGGFFALPELKRAGVGEAAVDALEARLALSAQGGGPASEDPESMRNNCIAALALLVSSGSGGGLMLLGSARPGGMSLLPSLGSTPRHHARWPPPRA